MTHSPPHFSCPGYAGKEDGFEIETLKLGDGKIAPRPQKLVLEWAALHRRELMEDWELCREHHVPRQIKPLD